MEISDSFFTNVSKIAEVFQKEKDIALTLLEMWFSPFKTIPFMYYHRRFPEGLPLNLGSLFTSDKNLKITIQQLTDCPWVLQMPSEGEINNGVIFWNSQPPPFEKNQMKSISRILHLIVNAFNLNRTVVTTLVYDSIINLFLKLTTFPGDSIVPIIDLINESLYSELFLKTENNQVNTYRISKSEWAAILSFFIDTLNIMNVTLPAIYYPKLKALGRDTQLTKTLAMLDTQFAQWSLETNKKE